MHPMICFVVLTAIVGFEAQLVNVLPQRDDDLVELLDVGRCLKAVKNFCPCGWAKCVRRKDGGIWSTSDSRLTLPEPFRGSISYSCTHELTKCCPYDYDIKCCEQKDDFFLPVSKKCRKEMKEYCTCGWAVCSRNMGSLSDKCCPDNYSMECCASDKKCIDECVEIEKAGRVDSVKFIEVDIDELIFILSAWPKFADCKDPNSVNCTHLTRECEQKGGKGCCYVCGTDLCNSKGWTCGAKPSTPEATTSTTASTVPPPTPETTTASTTVPDVPAKTTSNSIRDRTIEIL
uniref:Uncharacterized protein n=1 Tax=Globodera rostochiensis TaxID=31243 RepID=A0A914GVY4_GLORO